ncbi:sensor histidine kinase KdpD [Anabaena sphaerica FACHB-251]|uniref:Sensor histidine kinase KdpD n=1 Tax=Anabaena sphaerica FACHB-251 TaxID=2692883 RepID=A0A926WI22_9NOST|nr:sensor histidine kinase KdpD [Anabaena sphaerica]MBD2294512.1 sensor histidine kinase KdpD [Anabaena sphaerica FACHB-251]
MIPSSEIQLTPANYPLYSGRRGKHKIFIGMAPGVGKTYRMLEEGHGLKQEGIDVVIGLLETHERKETAEKAAGLEIIPPHLLPRGDLMLPEMDTQAIIHRSPELVLVDELAHTNVRGSLREKRYEDVEVILAAGLDVYSTMNVQHLESLNNIVARITGVVVRERVPDRILEVADDVVVVDVTPEILEKRLLEGKIYTHEKIPQALDNFFQRRNLIALRELALREVADNVEEDAIASTSKGQICSVQERVLVCVSTYPNSVQLLRRGARLAGYMNAPFYVLFVANPDRFLTKEESLHVDICEQLCKEFAGNFVRATSSNIAQTISEVAEKYRITQIVIGESQRSRWEILLKVSLTQKLMRLLKNIDLHIIPTGKS